VGAIQAVFCCGTGNWGTRHRFHRKGSLHQGGCFICRWRSTILGGEENSENFRIKVHLEGIEKGIPPLIKHGERDREVYDEIQHVSQLAKFWSAKRPKEAPQGSLATKAKGPRGDDAIYSPQNTANREIVMKHESTNGRRGWSRRLH